MTATLSFQLPEEQSEFQVAVDGVKWYSTVQELDEWLRTKIKHGSGETAQYEEVRNALRDILSDNLLSLDSN